MRAAFPVATLALVLACPGATSAQELEPRAYAPSPLGAQFVLATYSRSTGGVLFDPSLPITNVEADVNSTTVAWGLTFGLGGRLTTLGLVAPYAWGTMSGDVAEERRSVDRSGLGDLALRAAINLKGVPALSPREFAARKPTTVVGFSLTTRVPSGQYDPAKLINIGTNRWAFKPELGMVVPAGRWSLEIAAGAWLYTQNDEFFGGSTRSQQALGVFQIHAVYAIRPRAWVSFDANFYTGGRTSVNDVERADLQRNSRFGGTFVWPFGQRHAVKVAYSRGAITRIGGDFDTIAVGWQYVWVKMP